MKHQKAGFVNTFRNIYFKFVFASGGAALTEIVPSSTPPAIAMATGPGAARGSERGRDLPISSDWRPSRARKPAHSLRASARFS